MLDSLLERQAAPPADELSNERGCKTGAKLGVAAIIWIVQAGLAAVRLGTAVENWIAVGLSLALCLAGAAAFTRVLRRRRMASGAAVTAGLYVVHRLTLAGIAGVLAPATLDLSLLWFAGIGGVLAFCCSFGSAPAERGACAVAGFCIALLIHIAAAGATGLASPLAPALLCAGLAAVCLAYGAARIGAGGEWAGANSEGLLAVAEALPVPIIVTSDDNRHVLFANEQSRRQFLMAPQLAPEDLSTETLYGSTQDLERFAEASRHNGGLEGQMLEMRRSDGSKFWALSSARPMTFAGRPAILAAFFDVTDRKAAEEALLASEVRYALISRAANDGIWDWDIPSGTVFYSARWKEIVGAESQRLNSVEDWFTRVHPDDLGGLRRAIDSHLAGDTPQLDVEYRLRHGDGCYRWMQCRGIALRRKDGAPTRMAGSQTDVSLRKTYEINLRNAAYEDSLTGLNNRAFFTQLVDGQTSESAIRDSAVLLLNIDQFRRVNDNLGTAAGDTLLTSFARRLATQAEPQDVLARLGGDEFAVWLHNVPDHPTAVRLAESILAELSKPYMLGDAQMPVVISAGLASAAVGGATQGAELVHNARLALDRSKQVGEGRCVPFDEELLKEEKLRQRLSRDLAAAGRLGQIFLEYQPVVALGPDECGRVHGFEALMRWRHPELGLIPPGTFVPLAEEAGLIGSLGMLAIEHAAREIESWTDAGLASSTLSVAVNLSARQISDPVGVERLYNLLDRLTLPSGRLKLEITESVLMNDPDAMARTFRELRARGIELSLDDFGTGYSSLSYLHRFPLNVLKVDRSFTSQMLRVPEALRLVRSIIELAHDLGLAVVAEGVETAEELDCLRGLRCDYGQGYFFSRPVPAREAERLLIHGIPSRPQ